ncbi:hypothetical protein V8F20_006522 [Naviculisporaceae sp. PSN 640]
MSSISPISLGGRQESCSFRTRLIDDNEPNDDLDYITPTAPLGRVLPGNPYLPPSDVLFPEPTPTSESDAMTQIHPTTALGPNYEPANISFQTLEEFSDTVMVNALQPQNENMDNAPCETDINSRKRKSCSSLQSEALSLPRKRATIMPITVKNIRLGQQCQSNDGVFSNNEGAGDISDDWSVITDVDIAGMPMPAYGPSTIMDMTQSVQDMLLRQARMKAKQARRKMRTLKRSCRTMFRSAFDYPCQGGSTKCISVGGGSW